MSQHLNMLSWQLTLPTNIYNRKMLLLGPSKQKKDCFHGWFEKSKKPEKLSFSSQPSSKSTKEILQRTPKDLKKNWWLIIIVQHKAANQPVSEEQMGYIKQAYSSVLPDSQN